MQNRHDFDINQELDWPTLQNAQLVLFSVLPTV